ncbi:MAG: S8 family serine peptidase [Steroidobacteraceae bacterium]
MRWFAGPLALCLMACTSGQSLRSSATLSLAARASPQRYIVVTVRNPVSLPHARAASTSRGYDGVGPYLAGGVARTVSRALARDYRLRESASWPIALLDVHCLVYELSEDMDQQRLLAVLAHDARVESAQPLLNFETAAGGYNDPYAQLQRDVQQMSIADAQALSRGAGVRVAVIDTGVDTDHPDLPATIASRNFVDNDTQSFRTDAHGTAVAGVIAAVPNNGIGIVGIAPDVSLLAYKACWRASAIGIGAVCNTFTLAQAIAAAIEARADIINLSLGGPSDPLLTRLVRRGLDAGIIVVGAVPSDGLRNSFPTDITGVIAADAIEANHMSAGVVEAPGRDVVSLAPEGRYDFYSGSSLATAEITGIIALLRSQRSRLSGQEAQMLLTASAGVDTPASRPSVPNACAALGLLLHKSGCAGNLAQN